LITLFIINNQDDAAMIKIRHVVANLAVRANPNGGRHGSILEGKLRSLPCHVVNVRNVGYRKVKRALSRGGHEMNLGPELCGGPSAASRSLNSWRQ
jgi:hypothetical protein